MRLNKNQLKTKDPTAKTQSQLNQMNALCDLIKNISILKHRQEARTTSYKKIGKGPSRGYRILKKKAQPVKDKNSTSITTLPNGRSDGTSSNNSLHKS